MRAPNQPFRMMRYPSVVAGLSIAALALATTGSLAQFRSSASSNGPTTRGAPQITINQPGFDRADHDLLRRGVMGRFKGRRGNASSAELPPGGDGVRRPPGRRPPHGKHPPRFHPIVPGVGVGVQIGTVGPAIDNPPPARPRVQRARIYIPPRGEQRFVKDEVVLEFAGNYSSQGIARLLARHRLTQLEAQNFTLTNALIVRARITNRRSVSAVLRGLGNERGLSAGQANFLYRGSQQTGAGPGPAATITGPADAAPKATPAVAAAGMLPAAGDPAQYALAKLHLNEAHKLATGDKVLVAVIDSGIDLGHPELRGVVAGSYDALGGNFKPHAHGTAIAGAIAAHARLMGAAPAARILAIRAFSPAGGSVEATTFAILKGIEYAAVHHARVINMSFAGPADPGLARQLAAAFARGVVLVAASGNLGPKSPPQYPAADPDVIAVSATDAHDQLFKASNIGRHIAVSAPGVDILLPAPGDAYQVSSGTSFSAAYVSGVVALLLQRAPDLAPHAVRRILQSTARDLGPRGKDTQYGAGLVDAYEAITAVEIETAKAPVPLPRPAAAR